MLSILLLTSSTTMLQIPTEVGPEGHKLLWLLIVVAGSVIAGIIFLIGRKGKFSLFIKRRKVVVSLKKDRIYYPRYLELTIKNEGNQDIDIDCPLLILNGIWYNRKFKLKGTNNRRVYPLYLMKNQNHTLTIDLHRFYGFDRTLKRLPKAKVVIRDLKGHRLGSRQVLLRKTLFNN
ncbi:MAG TPA: hypothetical protein VFD91_06460 [Mariniphaga sp.]|nr:hypothetical protein [Mariniphaga sp.]